MSIVLQNELVLLSSFIQSSFSPFVFVLFNVADTRFSRGGVMVALSRMRECLGVKHSVTKQHQDCRGHLFVTTATSLF